MSQQEAQRTTMPAAAVNAWQDVRWFGIDLRLPAHWDIVGHTTSRSRGRLVLRDRRRQRLLLTWATARNPPDVQRLFSDYRARDRDTDAEARFRELEIPGWHGYHWHAGTPALARAGRFDEAGGRWLEATFSDPDQIDLPTTQAVLESLTFSSESRWSAFGIDVRTPDGLELAQSEVRAGETRFGFARAATAADVVRCGMADSWFDGDLVKWLHDRIPDDHPRSARVPHARGPALAAETNERVPGVKGVLSKRRRHDLVWHDVADNAVYHVMTSAPSTDLLRPEQLTVLPGYGPLQSAPAGAVAVPCPVLDGRPVRNVSITESRRHGALQLSVPIVSRWYNRRPFKWLLPISCERKVGLDAIGEEVWRYCDGRRTEEIIDCFASRRQLRFHEARQAVLPFLQQLMRRGCVAVLPPDLSELEDA